VKRLLLVGLLPFTALSRECFREKLSPKSGDFTVELSRYLSPGSGRHVLIIPPTGGVNFLDRSYAREFCSKGINAWIVETWTDHNELNFELSIHTRFYARAQRAIDLALEQIPAGDTVGILGTSVGAFHAAIAAGRQPRLQALFTITGGGDIAEMIVHSDQGIMQVAKKRRYEMYGFADDETYLSALREHIKLEPLNYSDAYLVKKTGMVIASADTTVPTSNQERLRTALRPVEVLELRGNHLSVILRSWFFHSGKIVEFFRRHLPSP
jgi:hypothetical protein